MYKKNQGDILICSNDTDYRLKILFLHNTLPEYRIEWFREMRKKADMEYIFTNEGENYKTEIEKSRLPESIFLSSGRAGFLELKQVLNRCEKYDVIELPPIDTIHEYLISKMTIHAAKQHGIKLAYFWEKWEAPKRKQPLKRKIKNWLLGATAKNVYKDADIIFAGSTSSKRYFIEHGIDDSRIIMIPNCSVVPDCPYEDIRAKYGIDGGKTLLLYFGRLMPEKGLKYLIKTMTKLDNNYHLLVAGDGDARSSFEKLANSLSIRNITFAGMVNPKVRKNYFEQCDVFIFPGTYYGGWVDVWGLTNNEAIQFNKPVISTYAVGSAIDLIRDGVNGYIIEPESIGALRDAIIKMASIEMDKLKNFDVMLSLDYSAQAMAEKYIGSLKM